MKKVDRISSEKQDVIIARLEENGANLPCPRCGNEDFTLSDGYTIIPVRGDIKGITIGGRAIPCVMTVCDRCGYVSMHALGSLELMDMAEECGENDGEGRLEKIEDNKNS